MSKRINVVITRVQQTELEVADDFDEYSKPFNQLSLEQIRAVGMAADTDTTTSSVYAELIEEPTPITLYPDVLEDHAVDFDDYRDENPDAELNTMTHFHVFAFISPRDGASVLQIDTNEHHPHIRITLNEHDLFDGNTEENE